MLCMYIIRPTCDKEEDSPVAERSGRSQCKVLVVERTYPDFKDYKIDGIRIFVTRFHPDKRRVLFPETRLEQT